MLTIILNVFLRIISNSYSNVCQKFLTKRGESSSVVNFFTYLGLSILALFFINELVITKEIIKNVLYMGFLGATGNYFIIKALSVGELSTLAPINSYKPVIAMLFAIIYLHEIPAIGALLGLALIILGTYLLTGSAGKMTKAFVYRFLALIFSGIEAVFIKKIILISDIKTAFIFWAFSGLFFALIFIICTKKKITIKPANISPQLLLIILTALMQYTTNYVFSKINVSYALALFQLSTIFSIFLGISIFKEKELMRKVLVSVIMMIGACLIILS